jgi:peroxiredoxin
MLPLGTEMPTFSLYNTMTGEMQSFPADSSKEATLVMFICNHCPFVKHIHEEMVRLFSDYGSKGVQFVAISSNDVENYPADSPDKMKALFEELKLDFPYLYDEEQAVAKAFDAACTPDFYVFDANEKLFYRGQLDDSRPGNDLPVTGKDIRAALDAILEGSQINPHQTPSIGCNIKWIN